MFLTGIGTATPPNRFTQRHCWDALAASGHLPSLAPRSQAILRKVLLGDSGICSRYLGLDNLLEAFEMRPDVLDARFARHAPGTAARAAERAMAQAEIGPDDVDAIVISTCTGYLCPGLSSYVSEQLGLRRDVLALDLVGQGCGAALPNMRIGEALIAAGRARKVLSVCVEICSAAMYMDDDPGVLISACLFGDGAGAAVLSAAPDSPQRCVEWKAAGTQLTAADRDQLRFEKRGGMLRNILSPAVPALAGFHARKMLDGVLERAEVDREEIQAWILHAGGREILSSIREQVGISEEDTQWSARVLREYGNVSSPCVYFVLEAALNGGMPGGYWWMSSFGAGFSCHGALLQVSEN